MCGIDGAGLAETVERFNCFAADGTDPDYGRGESAYNRALGDPNPRVHPCLGPIDEPPYYACEVVPGDIGTCGGLVTDEHSRVLDEQRRPIPGLYAVGEAAGFGGGGIHGYRALEGTFLGGCLFTGRQAGRAIAGTL